jgi:hypothetical protein
LFPVQRFGPRFTTALAVLFVVTHPSSNVTRSIDSTTTAIADPNGTTAVMMMMMMMMLEEWM